MRVVAGLFVVPFLIISCGHEPLDADQHSSAQGVGAQEKDDEARQAEGSAEPADEVTVIDDEPVAPPPIVSPPPPEPSGKATGKEACSLFASTDQAVLSLKTASWQYQMKDCQSSACWDFFSLDAKCSLAFQHDNQKQTAQVAPDVCRSAATVFTSARFVAATNACPSIADPINESFEVDGAVNVRRKFSFCNTREMEEARACLRWVVDSTFTK